MVGEPSHPGQLCAALDWPFFGKWNKEASHSGHLCTSCGVTQAEIWPVACSLLPVSLVIIALIKNLVVMVVMVGEVLLWSGIFP